MPSQTLRGFVDEKPFRIVQDIKEKPLENFMTAFSYDLFFSLGIVESFKTENIFLQSCKALKKQNFHQVCLSTPETFPFTGEQKVFTFLQFSVLF